MSRCANNDTEALVYGELDPPGAARARRHLRRCSACRREAAWLRAERRVFAERARRDRFRTPSLAALVADRRARDASPACAAQPASDAPSERRQRRGGRRRRRLAPLAVACAAAAALVAVMHGAPRPPPEPLQSSADPAAVPPHSPSVPAGAPFTPELACVDAAPIACVRFEPPMASFQPASDSGPSCTMDRPPSEATCFEPLPEL